METSILLSTKQILGLTGDVDAFDLSVMTHINTAFSTLYQLGVGPVDCVVIEDALTTWESLSLPAEQLSAIRTYVFLKTQMFWDTPTTSFLIAAREKQIAELEWRISEMREEVINNAV